MLGERKGTTRLAVLYLLLLAGFIGALVPWFMFLYQKFIPGTVL